MAVVDCKSNLVSTRSIRWKPNHEMCTIMPFPARLQFWRNTADGDVIRFLKLFTELPMDEIRKFEHLDGAAINKAKVTVDFSYGSYVRLCFTRKGMQGVTHSLLGSVRPLVSSANPCA